MNRLCNSSAFYISFRTKVSLQWKVVNNKKSRNRCRVSKNTTRMLMSNKKIAISDKAIHNEAAYLAEKTLFCYPKLIRVHLT